MCYYTFLNEKLLQRYTFFMIYANLFAKKCGEATILCENCVAIIDRTQWRRTPYCRMRRLCSLTIALVLYSSERDSSIAVGNNRQNAVAENSRL